MCDGDKHEKTALLVYLVWLLTMGFQRGVADRPGDVGNLCTTQLPMMQARSLASTACKRGVRSCARKDAKMPLTSSKPTSVSGKAFDEATCSLGLVLGLSGNGAPVTCRVAGAPVTSLPQFRTTDAPLASESARWQVTCRPASQVRGQQDTALKCAPCCHRRALRPPRLPRAKNWHEPSNWNMSCRRRGLTDGRGLSTGITGIAAAVPLCARASVVLPKARSG